MRLAVRVLLLSVVVAGAAGCGGTPATAVNSQAGQVLGADVNALASAAHAHDPSRLSTALKRLRADVAAQQRSGQVSSTRASQILDAAARVESDVSTTPATHPPAPAPATDTPTPDNGQGKGNGKGKDKGNGSGGGGDGGDGG
jgi:hypothetical protein